MASSPEGSKREDVTREDVIAVQNAWAGAIKSISQIYGENGDYAKAAESAASRLYAYGRYNVLFKPTKAAEHQFRPKVEEAMSYFIGCNAVDNGYAEDGGFAINGGKGWSDCVYDNHQIDLNGDVAIAMGNYYFTCASTGERTKVEYTFGYQRCDDGKVRIFLHHSSVPYKVSSNAVDSYKASSKAADIKGNSLASKAAVTREDVIAVQNAWAGAIKNISKIYKEHGDYAKAAESAASELYAYGRYNVLFKPTKAAEHQFRPKVEEAMSYFIGCNAVDNGYAEDGGFAINGGKGWSDCVYDNHQIELKNSVAIAMGNYYFTCASTGEKTKVEYTFGYKRCDDGKVRIFLHHSSVPYAGSQVEGSSAKGDAKLLTGARAGNAGNLLPGFQLPSWWKVAAFTFNLLCGLVMSQLLGAFLDKQVYKTMHEVVHILTMWALSYIMINVGYEFTVDKNDLAQYAWDYLIAMTAAGFPWLFVALWFMLVVDGMEADEAFLVARFAAPTSAGILFSMLEGAGLRDTWVFSKARVLAIFDDLDTILLMIPLKIVMIGFKWELMVVIGIMVILLAFAWRYLHRLGLPHSSAWSLAYAAVVTAWCYGLYKVTKYHLPMEAIHIEVLLPAFVVGCMIDTPCARHELMLQRQASLKRRETKQLKAASAAAWPDTSVASPPQHQQADTPRLADEADTLRLAVAGADEDKVDPGRPALPAGGAPFPPGWIPPGWVEDEAAAVELGVVEPGGKSEATQGSHDDRQSVHSDDSRLSRHGHSKDESHPHESDWEDNVQTSISMVFMVLVGLSMPPLAGKNAKGDSNMSASLIAAHVLMVSVLMIIGKMFPVVCYRDEASWKERLALCLGMCPRGEVGASIIVISLELGVEGPAVIISMCSLVINLVLSGGFIGSVKLLLRQVATAASQKAAAASQKAAAGQKAAGPQERGADSEAVTLAKDF